VKKKNFEKKVDLNSKRRT